MELLKIAIAAATLTFGTVAIAEDKATEGHMSLDTIEWQSPGIPGVSIAYLYGEDEGAGARWMFKLEPGASVPMHTHTNTYYGTTIEGQWVHIHEDGTETVSKIGDVELIKGGAVHGDRCDGDVPCIGLLDFLGKRDVALAQ